MKDPFWNHPMYSAGELMCYLILTNAVWYVWDVIR